MEHASRISATEAARTFSSIISRVQFKGESFIVDRGGKPVCRISPAGPSTFTFRDLARLLSSIPKPDEGFARDVEEAVRRQGTLPGSPWQP